MSSSGWEEATTFEELCELSAGWFEGSDIVHFTQAEPDEETGPLCAPLARLNRAGLFTMFSQPGQPLTKDGFAQRAAVQGFASEELARRLYTVGLSTDLVVFAYPPGVEGGYMLPISLDEFHPFTWCGAAESLEPYESATPASVLDILSAQWGVVAIDPAWGREDLLWDRLLAAVGEKDSPYSSEPSPSLGLDDDFVF